MHLAHVARRMDLPAITTTTPARALAARRGRRAIASREIARPVGFATSRRPHRAGQHHRLARAETRAQEIRGLLERVGAVRDDDARDVGPRAGGARAPASARQVAKSMSLLSICATCSVSSATPARQAQPATSASTPTCADRSAIVVRRRREPGDRAAGAEDHDCACSLCIFPKLDENTALDKFQRPARLSRRPTHAEVPMQESPKLTDRQQQILDLVQSAIERTGAPPTRAEIANELGFKSANAAEEHLQALARKGVIELVGGTSRGIRLQSDTLRALNQARGKQYSLPLPSLAQLSLPLIGRVAAGSPILAQEHIDRTFLMEASMFSRRPDYLLKVRGMSMSDAGIMDGDLLAVQKAREAKNGQIVVARLGDDVTVKRFKQDAQRHRAASPRTPSSRPSSSAPEDEFEIEGLAVGLIRNNMLM